MRFNVFLGKWEKASCPLAALSLHYQPTKNSFHTLFAPFSLTLFLSLFAITANVMYPE